ncbi:MAG: DUF2157 domain-containing protein [Saprospiraceae bacterium]
MHKIDREDIRIFSRHSHLKSTTIDTILKETIYHDKSAWKKFIKLFCLSLGVGFTTVGIMFFFAYNWDGLDKFVKIGIIELLLISVTLFAVFFTPKSELKNILMTSAVVLVGVLLAVFGQIYQTGANAYDFFLGWTLFVTLWVVIVNYSPLWLIYLVLIYTTFTLYADQMAHHWSEIFVLLMLFIINSLWLSIFLFGAKISDYFKAPSWFTNVIALACTCFSTVGIVMGIFDDFEVPFVVLTILTAILYVAGLWYGYRIRQTFYLSVIPLSVIMIISALLVKISSDALMFIVVSLFVISSVTIVIKYLLHLQKKWNNE